MLSVYVCVLVTSSLEREVITLHVLNVTKQQHVPSGYHMLATKRGASGSSLMRAGVLWTTILSAEHDFELALAEPG